MQIIQTIRDKGAAIVIAVIALSLIGFILMDSNQGGNSLFSSISTNVGKVNGETIELDYFNRRIRQAETMEEQRTQQKLTSVRSMQIREQMWNQIVAEKVFYAEAKKLGINFTSKELSYILLSNDQNNPLLQEQGLVDPQTGKLNVAEAQKALNEIKKFKGERREAVDAQIIDPLKLNTIVGRYNSLLQASAYYPEWMKKKEIADQQTFSTISYVAIPYSEIPDSTVKVTDAEINEYVNKNKDLFKQEAGRKISYISFSQLPSREDSVATRAQLDQIRDQFAADSNAAAFVARNASSIEFVDEFQPRSKITSTALDSILSQPAGTVYGPYVEGRNFVLAKVVATKQLPDSVRAKHILIAANDPQTGAAIRDDSTAKKLADSLLTAINNGASFTALAAQFSADGSKDKGGDLGTFGYGVMVPEFNEFTFTKPVGTRGVVRTQFGYHVIEVTNQSHFNPAYKIAYIGKEINSGDATINAASLAATKASAQKNAKALRDYASKNGLAPIEVPTLVKENDFMVGSLQEARPLVRWAFEAETGDVSEPFAMGDQFVVAMVDKIYKEGVQDAETARSGAEPIIRNRKKADIIIKKVGATPTLEAAAAAYNKQVQQAGADSSITMASQVVNGIGVEPKLIGASFHKEFQQKPSPAFGGSSGVYVIKVNALGQLPAALPEMEAQRQSSRLGSMRSETNDWYEGLRKLASIKDKRSTHY